MPAKKALDPKEKPQKQRFIEAAKKAGVEAEAFERAMGKITPPVSKKPSRRSE